MYGNTTVSTPGTATVQTPSGTVYVNVTYPPAGGWVGAPWGGAIRTASTEDRPATTVMGACVTWRHVKRSTA